MDEVCACGRVVGMGGLSGCSKGIGPLPQAEGWGGVGRRRGSMEVERTGERVRGSDIVVSINYDLQLVSTVR